jgi:hypothetical protein
MGRNGKANAKKQKALEIKGFLKMLGGDGVCISFVSMPLQKAPNVGLLY